MVKYLGNVCVTEYGDWLKEMHHLPGNYSWTTEMSNVWSLNLIHVLRSRFEVWNSHINFYSSSQKQEFFFVCRSFRGTHTTFFLPWIILIIRDGCLSTSKTWSLCQVQSEMSYRLRTTGFYLKPTITFLQFQLIRLTSRKMCLWKVLVVSLDLQKTPLHSGDGCYQV